MRGALERSGESWCTGCVAHRVDTVIAAELGLGGDVARDGTAEPAIGSGYEDGAFSRGHLDGMYCGSAAFVDEATTALEGRPGRGLGLYLNLVGRQPTHLCNTAVLTLIDRCSLPADGSMVGGRTLDNCRQVTACSHNRAGIA